MGQVAPRTGAWIETPVPSMSSLAASSRPARARGLKHQKGAAIAQAIQSRPARARGLKHRYRAALQHRQHVAPRTGAWIETTSLGPLSSTCPSRPARARGLKLEVPDYPEDAEGRAPHGRVD